MSNLIEKAGKVMSKFLEDALKAIGTIANHDADDQQTKDAVASLQEKVAADETEAEELKRVIQALVNQLAAAPANPDAPEVSTDPAS